MPCWGSWMFYFSLVSGLCPVCVGLYSLPFAVIGRLCSSWTSSFLFLTIIHCIMYERMTQRTIRPVWPANICISLYIYPICIMKTRLFKYTKNFTTRKRKFSDKKNSDIFNISAKNIDCGYSLEPPRRGGSNEYPQSMFLSSNKKHIVYPYKPHFYYIKVGFKGVKIIEACFRNGKGSRLSLFG